MFVQFADYDGNYQDRGGLHLAYAQPIYVAQWRKMEKHIRVRQEIYVGRHKHIVQNSLRFRRGVKDGENKQSMAFDGGLPIVTISGLAF